MNRYELTVLVNPNSEDEAKDALNRVAKIIADVQGKIISEEDQGKKRLEYKIKNETHATFHFYVLELASEAVSKVDQALNITDGILRHLIVKVDEKKEALKASINKTREE